MTLWRWRKQVRFILILCKMHKILIVPNIANEPTLVGVYDRNNQFLEQHLIEYPLSDRLVPKFVEFEKSYGGFEDLYFVRGPGSFMALKLIYLFAKTLEIARGVKLYATHAFHFNHYAPIKAYGNCYFVIKTSQNAQDLEGSQSLKDTQESQILLQKFPQTPPITPFFLPKVLNESLFDKNLKPLYILPPA